ncbi:MAG TPA: carbohydrate-binding protein [Verrucomicrobiae bacterium]|nr:carbohydrate-binding protein [Verrucomicrobiae bacterium]
MKPFLQLSGSGILWAAILSAGAQGLPADYKGRPFSDAQHQAGAAAIPGVVQCALYDIGGEGVAYHDADPINHGSGELNLQPKHQRPHASAYIWNFRQEEGVDISFVKDFADLNHTNLVTPETNQLYIGWTTNGEWCNYTVDVKAPGTYKIKALYSYQTNTIQFDLNGQPAATCLLPVATPSWHYWNKAEIGEITFPSAGLQLLTFHHGGGNNFAYFEFSPAKSASIK